MGGFFSSPELRNSLPQSPILTTPWREISWGNKQELLQYMKNFQPQNEEIEAIRVLLCGPIGAGTSSFINSVNSVLQGRMTNDALASSSCDDICFTKTYQTYKIKKEGNGNFYPLVFNDIMGLAERTGVRTDDIKLALKGHMKNGYKLKPSASLSDGDPGYNSSPSISDRVHVLVYIYSADAYQMKCSILQKMREIREAATELGIPQLMILTHIDYACCETEKNLRNVYKSKYLKKKMTDFSYSLGIPMNCVYPVKNYTHEIQPNADVDALILSALKQIVDFGGDYAKNTQRFVPAMGSGASDSLLGTPWREISSTNKHELLQYVKNFQPQNEKVKAIRVLLYGPVGAGKSSFINSVKNILQGRMTSDALTNNTNAADHSFTKKYHTYKVKKDGSENFYPFVFNDIMGLQQGSGVRADDIKLALKGHVKDGYKFNPVSPLSAGDTGYISSPSVSDRVHVLVCIYDANVSEMKSSVLQKMSEIREAASDLDIPQLAILTHIDAACGETERDLRNVYRSKHLKKKMGDFSSSLGISMNCILPVKNYSHEIQLNPDVDTLILSALKLIIDFGDDFADKLRT